MLYYRGLSAPALAAVYRSFAEFFVQLNMGPQTSAMLNAWFLPNGFLERLAAAKDKKALAELLIPANVQCRMLVRAAEAIAVRDMVFQQVFLNLQRLSAFSGVRFWNENDIEKEVQAFVAGIAAAPILAPLDVDSLAEYDMYIPTNTKKLTTGWTMRDRVKEFLANKGFIEQLDYQVMGTDRNNVLIIGQATADVMKSIFDNADKLKLPRNKIRVSQWKDEKNDPNGWKL